MLHTRTVRSLEAVTQRMPWRSIATALTLSVCPLSTCLTLPDARSQMQQCPSSLATTHSWPSGATATSVSGRSLASCITQSPMFMSHTCAVPSSETVMMSWPVGEMTTLRTGPLWPRSVMRCSPPACCSVAVRGIRCTTSTPAAITLSAATLPLCCWYHSLSTPGGAPSPATAMSLASICSLSMCAVGCSMQQPRDSWKACSSSLTSESAWVARYFLKSCTMAATPYACSFFSIHVGSVSSSRRSIQRAAPSRWCAMFCMM
mmetsp:Transcript_33288/g.73614  ORF Transcript_33288/g.73614 Transcript_33288/m.73614 type:complete len:261 (+) Transcript_33288:2458-3240(+)